MDQEYQITLVKDLLPDCSGVNLLGVVICKHSPKVFSDSRNPNSSRCVSSLTLRDQSGYINCNIWGTEEFVREMCVGYNMGNVAVITNAQVGFKSASDENFNPSNQSQYVVSIGDKQGGKIAACDGDFNDLAYLLHASIRPHNDFYNLSEIFEHGQSMEGQSVNVLAVVKKISPAQKVKSKNGRELQKMEITFFDNTSHSFTVVVWEPEYFSYIQQWSEKKTVIFAVDVRLSYNNFKKCMQGSFTNKTICIQDPDTNEAHQLYDYATEYANQLDELFGDEDDGELSRIDELRCYTVKEIRKQIESYCPDDAAANPLFRGITYAAITNFNVDDAKRRPWSLRCSACRYSLPSESAYECRNESCVTKEQPDKFLPETFYDMMSLSISDHTGTLDLCRISDTALEKMLGVPVDVFQNLASDDMTELKWSWLMERCKVGFKLNLDKNPVRMRIELCEKPSFQEAMSLIKSSVSVQ